MPSSKAIFLDRDGIITEDRADYVKNVGEMKLLPGIENPLRVLRQNGFRIIIVTNQSAVGRGLTTSKELDRIHDRMNREVQKLGGKIDAIYYCPHTPEDKCDCRKPEPGLIRKATQDLEIDLSKSWLVGDKDSDIEAARRAGCRGIKVPTNDRGLELAARQILSDLNGNEVGVVG